MAKSEGEFSLSGAWQRATALLVIALFLFCMTGCPPREQLPPTQQPPSQTITTPTAKEVKTQPSLRIRIVRDARIVSISGPAQVTILPGATAAVTAASSSALTLAAPMTITRADDGFVIQPMGAQAMAWRVTTLVVRPVNGPGVRIESVNYPGFIELFATSELFDVVNHLPLEMYIPGVLDGELYKSWHQQTYCAQAIAARSYAIAVSDRYRARHYDLENTTASQMYRGMVTNAKAMQAVHDTYGQVLTYQGHIIPAYYSSTAGIAGQDACVAFADGLDIPPLRGRYQGGWDAASPHFQWGPINRTRAEVAQRLVAWGVSNRNSIAALRDVSQIYISAKNSCGRPAMFTIVDSGNHRFDLKPEQFRFAVNFATGGLSVLSAEKQLKSSHVLVRVSGSYVQFYDGHGSGHGVGMSQFGAEAMANAGHNAASILGFYYPQSTLERAY